MNFFPSSSRFADSDSRILRVGRRILTVLHQLSFTVKGKGSLDCIFTPLQRCSDKQVSHIASLVIVRLKIKTDDIVTPIESTQCVELFSCYDHDLDHPRYGAISSTSFSASFRSIRKVNRL